MQPGRPGCPDVTNTYIVYTHIQHIQIHTSICIQYVYTDRQTDRQTDRERERETRAYSYRERAYSYRERQEEREI